MGPSSTGYPGYAAPRALSTDELPGIVAAFGAATHRALEAGFDTVEVHAAHGYLLHQFLSPLSNDRTDEYGGDLAARSRLLREVVAAVRAAWPEDRALLVRISATDWVTGGHTVDDSVVVAGWLRELGVDLIDVSSGGVSPHQDITPGPGYQVSLVRTDPPGRRDPHRRGRDDHRPSPGRGDPGRRLRGHGRARPGPAARPAVAAAGGARARRRGPLATPAPARTVRLILERPRPSPSRW